VRVALVQPRGSNWIPGRTDLTVIANRMAPLSLLSLAAALERDGHEVLVHDGLGPFAPDGLEANVHEVLRFGPDLVGFTTVTSSFPDAVEMAARIKDLRRPTITVAGGVFPTSLGPSLLGRFDSLDYLVLGEGERTLGELADGRDPATIAGLAFRANGAPTATQPRSPIADLDTLPFPAYRLLRGFPRHYHLPLFSAPASPGAPIVTSRGCPFSCSFCDRSVYGRGFRFQSAGYIHEHIALLSRAFGVRHLNIYDDLFTLHGGRIRELCELLIRKPLGVTFNCLIRVGHLDEELLPLLKRAGAWMISLGIETGDPDMIRRHKPGVRLEDVRGTVDRIRAAGLKVKGLFIAGLPGETPETLERTLQFMLALDLDEMNLSKFTPFHGAPVWGTVREEGTFDEDWRLMNCNNFVFVPKGFDSRAHLDGCYARAVKTFYTSRPYGRRLARRAWACRHSLWVMLRHLPSLLLAMRAYDRDMAPASVRAHAHPPAAGEQHALTRREGAGDP